MAREAEEQARSACIRAQQIEQDRLWAEAERARQEASTDAIIRRIEEDAQSRIDELEERAREAEDEVGVATRRLRRERRRRKRLAIKLDETTAERDLLRDQVKADEEVIHTLREQLDSRKSN